MDPTLVAAITHAEEVGGPSEDYERPKELPNDADATYEEGDEEPSGLPEESEHDES
jgi:hypothetical protein